MRRRIVRSMLLLAVFTALLASAALCTVFYLQFSAQVRRDLQDRAGDFAGETMASAMEELERHAPGDVRFTLVRPDGSVAFDSFVSTEGMEPHLSREEIEEALAFGAGESVRFSNTLEKATYYYALRLADGGVLRLARTTDGIWHLFAGALPVAVFTVLVTVGLAYFLADKLTRRVVEPINRMDFAAAPAAPYDELAPFVQALDRHRRQLARSSAELESRADTVNAIMDNMQEGVALLDGRGEILSLNRSAAAIFGVEGPMEGRNILELWRDADFSAHIQSALSGLRGEMELRREGREYRVLLSPVTHMGAVVFFLDVTERARAEKMRREFSANVSHELKTPLTSIYGNAEMLSGELVREEDRPLFYRKIMAEAGRLIALVEDIMMLSRLDEGGTQELFAEVSLSAVARECADALAEKAREHGVTIAVSGEGVISGSRSMLYEMFYNLLDNGIKYNRPGGSVEVLVSRQEGRTEVTVADTGIGIPERDQPRIFERFYRADKSRSKKSGGTGLGLAIVKHIVLTHNGVIRVSSRPDQGTRFTIVWE